MVSKSEIRYGMNKLISQEREAMWIHFSSSVPFAIKIYAGSINVVSGEPMVEGMATMLRRLKLMHEGDSVQDYVVTPGQQWLDRMATEVGLVRQFVAMPQDSGHSAEYQLTGKDEANGLQFEVTPQVEKMLEPASFQIFVRTLIGKTLVIPGHDNYTIADIKALIHVKEGTPFALQQLLYSGKQLQGLFSPKIWSNTY